MTDRHPTDVIRHPGDFPPLRHAADTGKSFLPDKGPSSSQALTVATLFPLGGLLLTLAGLTLTGSVIGLLVLTPLFLLFSPVLVPAALLLGVAVTGFLTSGAFSLTGLSALQYLMRQARVAVEKTPEQVERAKRRMAEAAGYVGQKTKETGEVVQRKAEETKRS